MTTPRGQLHVELGRIEGAIVVRPIGTLDGLTYVHLRDTLLKCATEQPSALLVRIDDLTLPSVHALTVFASVATRIAEWPGLPLLVVAERASQRALFQAHAVTKFVPVHCSLTDAAAAAGHRPQRSRAVIELVPASASLRRAKYFTREHCRRWQADDLAYPAVIIAGVFVDNTFRHTASAAYLRLEQRRTLLSIAVSDDDPRPPVLRERAEGGVVPGGLLAVAELATAWGCMPTRTGGKTVWATLRQAAPLTARRYHGE